MEGKYIFTFFYNFRYEKILDLPARHVPYFVKWLNSQHLNPIIVLSWQHHYGKYYQGRVGWGGGIEDPVIVNGFLNDL
jgi:hypothetical protein